MDCRHPQACKLLPWEQPTAAFHLEEYQTKIVDSVTSFPGTQFPLLNVPTPFLKMQMKMLIVKGKQLPTIFIAF